MFCGLQRESSDPTGFLSQTLYVVSTIRSFFYEPKGNPQKWDVVLLGELSQFSLQHFQTNFLQAVSWARYSRQYNPKLEL